VSRRNIIAGGAGAGLLALALNVATPEIITFEGQKTKAYRDIVGVLTVCAGHTGPDIVVGKVYSDKECHDLTKKDAKIAVDGVLKISPHLVYHPMQLAAAISFSYNVGTGTYAKSSIARLFNEGKFIEACNFLTKYKYAGGKVWQGLVNRRAREQKLCLSTLTKEGMKDVVD
jgi:lysozyme